MMYLYTKIKCFSVLWYLRRVSKDEKGLIVWSQLSLRWALLTRHEATLRPGTAHWSRPQCPGPWLVETLGLRLIISIRFHRDRWPPLTNVYHNKILTGNSGMSEDGILWLKAHYAQNTKQSLLHNMELKLILYRNHIRRWVICHISTLHSLQPHQGEQSTQMASIRIPQQKATDFETTFSS